MADSARKFRDSAIGVGTLAAGGGLAYAGYRAGQASGAVERAAVETEEAAASVNKVRRAIGSRLTRLRKVFRFSVHEFADGRARNENGEYAPQTGGGFSPSSAQAAYSPAIIQQRDRQQSMAATAGFGAVGAGGVLAAVPSTRAAAVQKLRKLGKHFKR